MATQQFEISSLCFLKRVIRTFQEYQFGVGKFTAYTFNEIGLGKRILCSREKQQRYRYLHKVIRPVDGRRTRGMKWKAVEDYSPKRVQGLRGLHLRCHSPAERTASTIQWKIGITDFQIFE